MGWDILLYSDYHSKLYLFHRLLEIIKGAYYLSVCVLLILQCIYYQSEINACK